MRITLRLTRNCNKWSTNSQSSEIQNLPNKFPGFKVLLVEDNPLNQKVVLHILKHLDCESDVASNGKEALALLQEKTFDLVLMDVSLPDMSGIEITEVYRKNEAEAKHLPIVALTAHAHQEEEKRCKKAGMDDFLVKPVFPEKLREVFHRFRRVPEV